MTSAASGSLLLNLEGLATMGIAWLVFPESMDRRLLLGAAAILAGAVVLPWQREARLDFGALLIAGACLSWDIDNNLTRKLSSADPVQIALIKGLTAGSTNLLLALMLGAKLPTVGFVVGGALVGFLGIGVSLVMFMFGLRHLDTAWTGAYFSLAPFIGAVPSLGILQDGLSLQLVAATALMALGLNLHRTERHDHEHQHEPLEHEHAHGHDERHRHHLDGPVEEPHSHRHRHEPIRHKHPYYPDIQHRRRHG